MYHSLSLKHVLWRVICLYGCICARELGKGVLEFWYKSHLGGLACFVQIPSSNIVILLEISENVSQAIIHCTIVISLVGLSPLNWVPSFPWLPRTTGYLEQSCSHGLWQFLKTEGFHDPHTVLGKEFEELDTLDRNFRPKTSVVSFKYKTEIGSLY